MFKVTRPILSFAPLASLALLASACVLTDPIVENPRYYRTDCGQFGWNDCQTYYYSADGYIEAESRDMITDIAQAEETLLASHGKHLADKYALSEDQGVRMARVLRDYQALQTRSGQDQADFAQRLYGIEPSRIVEAAGLAQAGETAKLERLVEQAARSFETTPENMKRIVRDLHGALLKDQGITL
jgi:hypothetical protein